VRIGVKRPGLNSIFAVFIFQSVFLACFIHGAWADGPARDDAGRAPPTVLPGIEDRERFYVLEARRSGAEAGMVEIMLRPARGYYLNGKDYPPLSIEFSRSCPAATVPGRLAAEGVEKNGVATWIVGLKGEPKGSVRLSGRIRAVVCGDSSCRPIDEDFELEIK
jgi:hypothetical protein